MIWDFKTTSINFGDFNFAKVGYVDALDGIRMVDESSVTAIGAFAPGLRKLKARGSQWCVVKQDPRTLKDDEKGKHSICRRA
ncbi:MAG: hypothetical protein P8X68_07830 [Desulfobacterales bacterium]